MLKILNSLKKKTLSIEAVPKVQAYAWTFSINKETEKITCHP
jgi:hypothetical protein